jgi:hypothetical protein
MITFSASTYTSAARLTGTLAGLANAVRGEARRRGTERGAALILAEARRRAPRGPETQPSHQHLADTLGTRLQRQDDAGTAYAIGTDDERGPMMEFGTRPHVILPREAGALWWPGAAHPVGRVSHPGTRPRPFLIPAGEALAGAARDAVGEAIIAAAREAAGMGSGGIA